jgi:hypothetical protein
VVKVSLQFTDDKVNIILIFWIGYVDPESDGGLEEDLANRRYRSLLPEDDYDSDE